MSPLTTSKILLYFLIAALTVFIGGIEEVMTLIKWVKLISSSSLAGLVAVRAFVDRSFATEQGTPIEPANPDAPKP